MMALKPSNRPRLRRTLVLRVQNWVMTLIINIHDNCVRSSSIDWLNVSDIQCVTVNMRSGIGAADSQIAGTFIASTCRLTLKPLIEQSLALHAASRKVCEPTAWDHCAATHGSSAHQTSVPVGIEMVSNVFMMFAREVIGIGSSPTWSTRE